MESRAAFEQKVTHLRLVDGSTDATVNSMILTTVVVGGIRNIPRGIERETSP